MYSRKTITLFKFMINIGFRLQCFPFKLIINEDGIPKLQRQKYKTQKCIWEIIIIGYALLQLTFLSLVIWYDLTFDTPPEETAQGFMTIPPYLVGIVFPLLTYLHWETWIVVFNSFIIFCERLRKYKIHSGLLIY